MLDGSRRTPGRKWSCADEKMCLLSAEALISDFYVSIAELAAAGVGLQRDHDCRDTAAARFRHRLPDYIRTV